MVEVRAGDQQAWIVDWLRREGMLAPRAPTYAATEDAQAEQEFWEHEGAMYRAREDQEEARAQEQYDEERERDLIEHERERLENEIEDLYR